MLLLLTLSIFVLLNVRVAPYQHPQLNKLELRSLLVLSLTAFAGLFYLGSQDEASQYYEERKDCKDELDASYTQSPREVGFIRCDRA